MADRPTIEDFVAAGVHDPDAPGADQVLEVLEYLVAEGVTLPAIVAAHREGRLTGAAGDQLIRKGQRQLTIGELCELTDIPEQEIRFAWRASGFPDPPADAAIFWPDDEYLFRNFHAAADYIDRDKLAGFTRVMGSTLARLADAVVSLHLREIERPIVASEFTPLDVAKASTRGSAELDRLSFILDNLFRHHVEVSIRRAMGSWELAKPTAVQCTGFVDLVDSTSLTEQLDADGISTLVSEFENKAADLVTARGGRVVKAIGDEIMYYTVHPAAAAKVALDLLDWARAHPLLDGARAGLNVGSVVWQDGDCYGPVVTVAARLVALAGPDEVLATKAVADHLDDETSVAVQEAGSVELRGLTEPVEIVRLARVP